MTDVTEQVKSEFEDDAEFIHVEFYEGNDLRQGPRRPRAWGLQSEPILFTIDSAGVVAARLEGAFSADELRPRSAGRCAEALRARGRLAAALVVAVAAVRSFEDLARRPRRGSPRRTCGGSRTAWSGCGTCGSGGR